MHTTEVIGIGLNIIRSNIKKEFNKPAEYGKSFTPGKLLSLKNFII